MAFRRCLQREKKSAFEQIEFSDVPSFRSFLHEPVNMSSILDANGFSSLFQQHALLGPADVLRHTDQRPEACVI